MWWQTRSPRLVATDLDGTVVRSDGTISERTVRALAAVEDAGATLVFVTGRPPRWMHSVAGATGHRGLAICANGALVYDLHDERVVASFLLEPPALQRLTGVLRRSLPGVAFAVDYGLSMLYEPAYRSNEAGRPGVRAVPGDELLAHPAAKLLAQHRELDADALLARAREVAGGDATFTHSSRDGLLEISASGVSKASTLARLCTERGITPGEVLAFGDMPNDLPLLAWAGKGYAVANAHPEVLDAVPLRTSSNDEDGVAEVLEQVFCR
ncbi:MAG: Cof-type HAD-IIB family hydrolase [Streptomycetales bacterium]